jgi:hypothetical protein
METRSVSKRKPKIKIIEKKREDETNKKVTYDKLLHTVNKTYNDIKDQEYSDEFTALQMHYNDNYYKKDLEWILGYYDISKRKKNKMDIVNDIVLFELDSTNLEMVNRRKLMWFYMEEINNDDYLSKYLNFY